VGEGLFTTIPKARGRPHAKRMCLWREPRRDGRVAVPRAGMRTRRLRGLAWLLCGRAHPRLDDPNALLSLSGKRGNVAPGGACLPRDGRILFSQKDEGVQCEGRQGTAGETLAQNGNRVPFLRPESTSMACWPGAGCGSGGRPNWDKTSAVTWGGDRQGTTATVEGSVWPPTSRGTRRRIAARQQARGLVGGGGAWFTSQQIDDAEARGRGRIEPKRSLAGARDQLTRSLSYGGSRHPRTSRTRKAMMDSGQWAPGSEKTQTRGWRMPPRASPRQRAIISLASAREAARSSRAGQTG